MAMLGHTSSRTVYPRQGKTPAFSQGAPREEEAQRRSTEHRVHNSWWLQLYRRSTD